MALDGAWNAYIFREGKTPVRGSDLVNGLTNGLLAIGNAPPQAICTALIDLLMRAGELEGALLDAASAQGEQAATITDELAIRLVVRPAFENRALRNEDLALTARTLNPPEYVTVTPPEGFAYYSLHPLDFADLVNSIGIDTITTGRYAAVIGIRSIGTILSAVVQAALRNHDLHAERITVRPAGHPYDRCTTLTSDQLRWIAAMLSRRADFFIVDEGPGMSGSSFLSVGDALLSAGVPRSRITFLGTREPNPSSLMAPNAARRWPAYRSYYTRPTTHLPREAKVFVAGGIWRAHVYSDQQQWPASWLPMERLKFFSAEQDAIFKFEGFGRFGQAVHNRSRCVAEAGFGPMPIRFEEGFGVYPMLRGRSLSVGDVNPAILERLAEYCAFRSRAIETSLPVNVELETMLRFNVKEEFGVELAACASELRVVKPVIVDGRMLPQKWIDSTGALLKLDSAIHGDDHFFPGPTDIAWDLAGTIIEWELDVETARLFLDCYYRASGDDASNRVTSYLLAYGIFRTAYCKMASASMQGSAEEARLVHDYHRYRAQVQQHLNPELQKPSAPTLVPEVTNPELRIA